MRLDRLLPRQSSCPNPPLVCPTPPACSSCADDEDCVQFNRTCDVCATVKCVRKLTGSSGKSSGVSTGALAGGVVGALIFLAAVIGLYIWYRRSQKAFKVPEEKKDTPAAAEDVLNRPDPTEKPPPPPVQPNNVRVYSISSNTTIDLDPESQHDSRRSARGSTQSNPFTDTHSIQTAGTEGSQGTNVIPIALVSQESDMYSHSSAPQSPARPVRSPDLNLDHANVSSDNSLHPRYAASQISGISAVSSRLSYGSNASYSSDFLNEAPTIVTPTRGTVRQLMGVVKAEVINAPGSRSLGDGSKLTSKPSIRSPLAASSFGPTDVLVEGRESQAFSLNDPSLNDPFKDQHVSANMSTATERGSTLPSSSSVISDWVPDEPNAPWNNGPSSRPASISTQAASIADIGNATRVNVGLGYATATPQTATFPPKSPFRQTMGRLVTPTTGMSDVMEEHQQYAMVQAQSARRASGSSVMSAASTRADSILESFPFVPPSPSHPNPLWPSRTPPASPLVQQSFANAKVNKQQSAVKNSSEQTTSSEELAAPSRKTLGMSTGSQFSTASSGLGSFTFQIDSGNADGSRTAATAGSNTPSSFKVARHRASLDTLALTSDLASYPLGFDRDSQDSYAAFAKKA